MRCISTKSREKYKNTLCCIKKYPILYIPYIDKFENTLNCMIPYIVKKKTDNVGHFADNKGYFRP